MRIVQYPHPALRHVAQPVQQIDRELRSQVARMFELMYEARGVALAATQVALPYRFVVINTTGDPQQKQHERVFVNPVITTRSGSADGEEGCLSFPGFFARVRRARAVSLEAYDLDGRPVSLRGTGMDARIWQHEVDHLDGVVFIDRFSEATRIATRRDIARFETSFRRAQEQGRVPPDAELERMMTALQRETA